MNKKIAQKKVAKKPTKKVTEKAESKPVKKVVKKKAGLKGTAELDNNFGGRFAPELCLGRLGTLLTPGTYKTKAGAKKGLLTLVKNLGLKVEIKWNF